MTEASEDKQEKLNKIWDAWNIATDATGKELWKALPAVEEWLLTGVSSPVVALRAAQILLLDPERPDSHKHACWSALKKVLRTVLGPGPIEQQHLLAGQALVLAAWPSTAHDGHFPLVPLLDSAWDVAVGRQRQQEELLPWQSGDSGSKKSYCHGELRVDVAPSRTGNQIRQVVSQFHELGYRRLPLT